MWTHGIIYIIQGFSTPNSFALLMCRRVHGLQRPGNSYSHQPSRLHTSLWVVVKKILCSTVGHWHTMKETRKGQMSGQGWAETYECMTVHMVYQLHW